MAITREINPKQPIGTKRSLLLLMVGVISLLVFSGCEESKSSGDPFDIAPPDLPQAAQPAPVEVKDNAVSAEATDSNPTAKKGGGRESMGIPHAGEILAAGKNAFLNKLPRPKIEEPSLPPPGQVPDGVMNLPPPPPPPPRHPLEGVRLSGIVFNSKTPMALLGGYDGGQSKIVRQGDTVVINNHDVKVLTITRDSVELMESGNKGSKKTLSLPSMVGFNTQPAMGDGESNNTILDINVGSDGLNLDLQEP